MLNSKSLIQDLPTGRLELKVDRCDHGFDNLVDLAARQNPKRGFLFVSKVLGRHIPVKPSQMQRINRELAAKIPENLPGPVVFIGMCETAICLGQSVFEEYFALTGREDMVFIHSTRYRLSTDLALCFEEEHCHASGHLIYMPGNPEAKRLFSSARSLVLVDDESSSGNTLVNLANSFSRRYPSLERVVTAVITDWRPEAMREDNRRRMPVRYDSVAILEGEYRFTPSPTLHLEQMPSVVGNGKPKDRILKGNFGRRGILPQQLALSLPEVALDAGASDILVLGTGEFAYAPYRLALELESRGYNVYCQATTRSPVKEGLAIESKLTFKDNYDDDIVNFLYNHRRHHYDLVLLCHETPESTLDSYLVRTLDCHPVCFCVFQEDAVSNGTTI